MIVIPAVDLRDGACVQLVGGSYADERVRLADPVAVALNWAALGFTALHVVDLDAATGAGSNAELVDTILQRAPVPVNVGGGVRSSERIDSLLAAGANAVVVGTRALEDSQWIADQAVRVPGKLIVAADVRGGRLAVRGWKESIAPGVVETVATLSQLPLAGLLVTAVDVEGSLQGPDLGLIGSVVAASAVPIIASGGIGSIADLRAVAERGAAAAVVGMALYSGAIDPQELVAEFGGGEAFRR